MTKIQNILNTTERSVINVENVFFDMSGENDIENRILGESGVSSVRRLRRIPTNDEIFEHYKILFKIYLDEHKDDNNELSAKLFEKLNKYKGSWGGGRRRWKRSRKNGKSCRKSHRNLRRQKRSRKH